MDRACKHLPSCKIWDAIEICAMRNKKGNQPINSSGLQGWDEQLTRNYLIANFSFLFLLAQIFVHAQTLHDNRCLCSLSSIFLNKFLCTNWVVTKVGNTVIRAGNTRGVLRSWRPETNLPPASTLMSHYGLLNLAKRAFALTLCQ